MTPEAQRIAIAEACGWTHPVDLRPDHNEDQWWTKGDNKLTQHLPDYLNDLNAMHEAENVLLEEHRSIGASSNTADTQPLD